MKVKLSDWASIAEIVSGLAIVVTLAILIFEIRGNTDAIRSQTAQDTFSLSFQANTFSTAAEALAYDKLQQEGPQALNETEFALARRSARAIFTTYDNHYYQYLSGNLDEEIHQAYQRRLLIILSRPGSREWWAENRELFTESFQMYVTELIANVDR